MDGEGMVTVVRALPDAGLCVTLLDGSKTYTLKPNTVTKPFKSSSSPIKTTPQKNFQQNSIPTMYQQNSGYQGGQNCNQQGFTHMYQAQMPTQMYQNQGYYGPNCHHCMQNSFNQQKSKQNAWTDTLEGMKSVCETSSQAVDGRYTSTYMNAHCHLTPTSPQVESTEFPPQRAVVPRGHENFVIGDSRNSISPTRMKVNHKIVKSRDNRGSPSPTRHPAQPDPFADSLRKYPSANITEKCSEVMERLINYTYTKSPSRIRRQVIPSRSESRSESVERVSRCSSIRNKCYEPEVFISPRAKEESPTRDVPRRYDCDTLEYRRSLYGKNSEARFLKDLLSKRTRDFSPPSRASKVNSETQATMPKMVSREVSTVPRVQPLVRDVATAVTVKSETYIKPKTFNSSIQTITTDLTIKIRKSVQTCFSNFDFGTNKIINERKTTSHYEIRINRLENDVVSLIQELQFNDFDNRQTKIDLIQKMKQLHERDMNERVKMKFNEILFNSDVIREISNEKTNITLPVHINTDSKLNTKNLTDVIKEWVKTFAYKNNLCINNNLFIEIVDKIEFVANNFENSALLNGIINIIKNISIKDNDTDLYETVNELVKKIIIIKSNKIQDGDLKEIVKKQLLNFMEEFNINICNNTFNELVDILTKVINSKNDIENEDIINIILNILTVTEEQANTFANNLINTLKAYKIKEPFIVMPAINNILIQKLDVNESYFTKKVAQEVTDWIENLNGIEIHDDSKNVLINELTKDIVEFKYKKLDKFKECYEDELGHIKFLIYRWFNRFIGVDNIEITEYASELMKRIHYITVDKYHWFSKPGTSKDYVNNEIAIECDIDSYEVEPTDKIINYKGHNKGIVIKDSNMIDKHGDTNCYTSVIDFNRNKSKNRRLSEPGNSKTKEPVPINPGNKEGTIANNPGTSKDGKPKCCAHKVDKQKLLEEYDEFLMNWAHDIPINESPELAEKLRLGLYNGVKEAMAKLNMNPQALFNPYYYKDVLDDEVEELINCLPQNPELLDKKDELKARVVERTSQVTDIIFKQTIAASYKQQLVDSIANVPIRNNVWCCEDDTRKYGEELIKLQIAENFIMFTKYRDDKIKAGVFKKKLLNEIDDMVEALTKHYGKPFSSIERRIYIDSMMKALEHVPVPTDETINKEADEILLCIEVDQWFSDLPFIPNTNEREQLMRRKQRDILAKKLHDLESEAGNIADKENEAKGEIKSFLRKMPLGVEGLNNEDFIVEELMNRLRNRDKDVLAGSDKVRKSIVFIEPYDYDEFSQDMPLCSSFSDDHKTRRGSYMIVGGERVDQCPSLSPNVQRRQSSSEWVSLQETRVPSAMKGTLPPCCESPAPNQSWNTKRRHSDKKSSRAGSSCANAGNDTSTRPGTPKPTASCCNNSQTEQNEVKSSCLKDCASASTNTPKNERVFCDAATGPSKYSEGTSNICSPQGFSQDLPIGYSTPQQHTSRPNTTKPRRKTREIEKSRREAAKKRLELEDSDNSSDDKSTDDDSEEERCKCLEKFLKRRKKRAQCDPCEHYMEFMPYFTMRYPRCPFFF